MVVVISVNLRKATGLKAKDIDYEGTDTDNRGRPQE